MPSDSRLDGQSIPQLLMVIYDCLLDNYGPQHWWPAEEPFEVMVGAILTQSVAWRNAARAIGNLKSAGSLSPQALRSYSLPVLANLIRPCGYYNAKALKLKSLVDWLGDTCNDDLGSLFTGSTDQLRQGLLSVYGIGEETADSILLYAAGHPVFVIDAYTRRFVDRLGLSPAGNGYAAYQALFMNNLTADVTLFNEYHALLVCLGKDVCQRRPLCRQCCLGSHCRYGASV
jgi:endonuclease-3 related protein